MKLTDQNMIDRIDDFIDTRDGGTVSWSEIKDLIETKFDLPENFNWLRARGALQAFISEGFLTRTEDLRVEVYAVTLAG